MKGLKFLTIALMFFLSTPAMAEIIRGEIAAISPETGFVTVKSEVMGLTGPEKRNIAYKIDEKTLLNLCWDGACNEGIAIWALDRLKDFEYFEAENISVIGKEVQLQYAKETAKIEAINIFAPVPTYYFSPADFVSAF